MAFVQTRTTGRMTSYFQDGLGRTRSTGAFSTYEEALIRAQDRDGEGAEG